MKKILLLFIGASCFLSAKAQPGRTIPGNNSPRYGFNLPYRWWGSAFHLILDKDSSQIVNDLRYPQLNSNWTFGTLSTNTILPRVTLTSDLGSGTFKWNNGYINTVNSSVLVGDVLKAAGGSFISGQTSAGTTLWRLYNSGNLLIQTAGTLADPPEKLTVTGNIQGTVLKSTAFAGSKVLGSSGTSIVELATPTSYLIGLTSDPQTQISAKQPQLNGTGFVKATGTTITYDNSTYLTTGTAASTYVAKTGDSMTGTLNMSNAAIGGYAATPSGNPSYYLTNLGLKVGNTDNLSTDYYSITRNGFIKDVAGTPYTWTLPSRSSTFAGTAGTLTSGALSKFNSLGDLVTATSGTDYQYPITLTTTGSSGPATLVANTLNIPSYAAGGGTVTSVSGTANRITSTGGTTPVIDISSTFEGLLLKKASNLSDLASASTARTNLGVGIGTDVLAYRTFGTAANNNSGDFEVPLTFNNGLSRSTNTISPTYGTGSNTFAQGNDSRINNGQTAFGWGNHSGLYALLSGNNALNGNNVVNGLFTVNKNLDSYTLPLNTSASGRINFGNNKSGSKGEINIINEIGSGGSAIGGIEIGQTQPGGAYEALLEINGTTKDATIFGKLVAGSIPTYSSGGASAVVWNNTTGIFESGGTAPVYSEGTWTPVPSTGGTALAGTYTKVGNLVRAHFSVSMSSSVSGSSFNISGLPFANSSKIGSVIISGTDVGTPITGYVPGSTSQIQFKNFTNTDITNLQFSSKIIYGTAIYSITN